MAGFGFFGPQAATPTVPTQAPAAPVVRPAAPTEMQQSSGFTEILKAPEVQAALIQFGINMLQPTYGGFGAQIGRSLGAAGAAAGRAAGQKQEREAREAAARREFEVEERNYGLAKRRTEATEKRAGGRGLSSLFSKAKPFPEWVTGMAKDEQESSFGEVKATDLLNDEAWLAQQRQVYERIHGNAGGEAAAAPASKPSQAAVMAEARRRLVTNPEARDAIIAKMKANGYDTTGL